MHIAILSAVYPPEPVVSAHIAQDIATFLLHQGAYVTLLCPQPSRPPGVNYSGYRNPNEPLVSQENGIEVIRLPSFPAPQSRLLARARESYSFGRHTCQYLNKKKERPDVFYVNSWPLIGQYLIARYAQIKNIPMVLQIMDIYPESLLNKLPLPLRELIASPLTKLDQWIARQAHSVVVISENMRRKYIYDRNIPIEKVVPINIWQDERIFDEPLLLKKDGCSRYGVPEDLFTFLYLGNVGPVAGVDFLIQAFHKAGIKGAQLLIVGDGTAKKECMKLANNLGSTNILFISDPDAKNAPLLQSMADVCLLPLKRKAGMSSIPSKLAAYMFSAKPILATVDNDSDTAQAIRQAECGWVEEPENINCLISRMRQVASIATDELKIIGQRGRRYGLAHFSKAKNVQRLSDVLLKASQDIK